MPKSPCLNLGPHAWIIRAQAGPGPGNRLPIVPRYGAIEPRCRPPGQREILGEEGLRVGRLGGHLAHVS
jgi:hypothetical protein